jgi:CRP/FNR family transcriptional regulator, anaerobic regulatory protein
MRSSQQCTLRSELAREAARSYAVMMLLGSTSAQERVAGFLLDLSRRHLGRGLSGSSLRLRMTRADIGSYLGITLETVSRTLSTFQKAGLMNVQQRALSILDVDGLERILETVRPKRGARAGCS